jgi:predicted nucleotidyltransferase
MRDLIDGTPPRQAAPSLTELRSRRDEILAICARHGASNVRIFGSVARGEQDDQSDVDFLVGIEDGRSLYDFIDMILGLEDALGCPVNVVEDAALKDDRFGRRVTTDAVPL